MRRLKVQRPSLHLQLLSLQDQRHPLLLDLASSKVLARAAATTTVEEVVAVVDAADAEDSNSNSSSVLNPLAHRNLQTRP